MYPISDEQARHLQTVGSMSRQYEGGGQSDFDGPEYGYGNDDYGYGGGGYGGPGGGPYGTSTIDLRHETLDHRRVHTFSCRSPGGLSVTHTNPMLGAVGNVAHILLTHYEIS
jgi:hypothetical protein